MNKDFSKYQKIIDNFSGQVLNSDFDAKFEAVTKRMAKTERFLLKMELKRLAAPCNRLIDLRGHVDGECSAFEHDGKIHFLDKIARGVFNDAMLRYGGYTFGVYEAAMNTENNFRVIYQKEKSKLRSVPTETPSKALEKLQFPATYYRFGPYFDRCEERMNFAVTIEITYAKGQSFQCTSADISVHGCKVRINAITALKIGQELSLRFLGLEEEFSFANNNNFSYQVKNITNLDNMQLIGLQRLVSDTSRPDGFSQFLQSYIQGNKRRYKVNLDNTLSALKARVFEQYVLPKSNELPVFIESKQGLLSPKYALTCHNNQSLYQYWQDEKYYSTLYCLITPERIEQLKKLAPLDKSLLVFCFRHQSHGKLYFYTADEVQLAEDESFMQQFLGFAAAKASFSIIQLSLLSVELKHAETQLTLANTLKKEHQYLNAAMSDEVKALLLDIPYIVVANEVTCRSRLSAYQAFSYHGINMVKLKKFGHKRLSKPFSVDEVGINYRNHRQELRFIYKTPAVVKIEDVIWHGHSHDFSTSGLKVELDKASVLSKGDIVYINFPALQKITSAFDLSALPYEVVRVNTAKTIINLRVFVEKYQHVGRRFFKALIEKNRDKLTPEEYAMSSPGLAKALRNIYSATSKASALIVQTSGSRYKVEAIAGGGSDTRLMLAMKQLSDRQGYVNLYPLFGHAKVMSELSVKLKKMQPNDTPSTELLYIAINSSHKAVDKAVTVKVDTELGSDKLKHTFIHQALKNGQFFCVLMKLSRASSPDMTYLNPELSYISTYAIHRGKQIEQEIWSVAGIVQVIDITNEVLLQYQLSRK
ncbi:PilZ domain-containing protein [Colwellia chukchiensis]|uniref:PilZ domain-containing protein n=1 Tax=Colwellia chukchiensis TaxID=641665 RepID=A0A1H7G4X5_9GAMM|nr:PilZ domain-containing protein [Colwellia chukchiensis]SEK33406.1 PilZ domain-containing protein [Colwellia chukchiensis]